MAHRYSYARSGEASYASPSPRLPARITEHIDDVDANSLQQDVLIPPWSPLRRASRLHLVLPSAHQASSSTHPVVIPPHQNTFTYNNGQDVQLPLSDVSRSSLTSTPNHHVRSQPLPTHQTSHNAALASSTQRLRTPLPVFGTTTELAAHYGIPRKLPPTPRTNNISNFKQPDTTYNVSSSSTSNDVYSQEHFQSMMSNYVSMVNTETSSSALPSTASSENPTFPMDTNQSEVAAQIASMFSAPEWAEFLTSPYDDESPFDNFLETPGNGQDLLHDFFTSPVVADLNSFDPSFTDPPVFFDEGMDVNKMSLTSMPPPPPPTAPDATSALDGLLTISPTTPALDPSSILPSPQIINTSLPSMQASRSSVSSSKPTGTRKNIVPESLIPLTAPTQPRNYITPSTTSRKELPAVFARKRARSAAFGDEEDELVDESGAPLDPTGDEAGAIAAKRRQNTLAARRSRKRKLEYQRELEQAVEEERQQKEMWKGRALMYRAHMQASGIAVPYVEDA